MRRYRHRDGDHLASLLARSVGPRRVVVTDSIFSMDGDRAGLDEVAAIADRHGATLVVDEAHAIGVMGEGGGGVCREAGCAVGPALVVGTLSKALGGYGGFVGCSAVMREVLVNRARSFIYSTGLPPACIGAARAALAVLASEPGMGKRLMAKVHLLGGLLAEAGLTEAAPQSQILSVRVGGNDAAVKLSQLLWDRGLLATAVRPPTVPAGTARLRLSVTLVHTDDELRGAARTIIDAAREVGLI